MKRIDSGDNRPTKEEVISRKRALVRSLIEQNGWSAPAGAKIVPMTESSCDVTLAPVIPFPPGGRLGADA
jgi:hypothetical protein